MNSRVSGLIFICFILLSGCFSTRQNSSEAPNQGMRSDDSAKTDLTFVGNQPKEQQETVKPSVSILDLYGNWKGQLVCNHQLYVPESTIYYSEDYVECEIQLDSEPGLNTTTDDLQTLEEKYVSVEDETIKENKERFEYIDFFTSADHPNLINFRISPSQHPLKIIFKTNKDQEPTAFNFEYAEPVTYTISRPFEADGKIYAKGVRQYLQTGVSHTYNITFSQGMDKDSVEHMLDEQLRGINKRIMWLSDQSLTLTLQPENKDLMVGYEEYRLNLSGVKTKKRFVNNDWQGNQTVRIQPATVKRFYRYHLLKGPKQPLFSSLIAYSSVDVSPNGKWILAEELSDRQSVLIANYSLLDLSGKRLKELPEVHDPVWLPDGNSLLFTDHHSVMRYDIPTGEKRVIWAADSQEPAIMSFEYNRVTGRLLAAAGYTDGNGSVRVDLYLLDSVKDDKPRQIKNVLHNQDEAAWHGLHYSLPAHFIGDGLIYLESSLPSDDQRGEYQKVRSIMDWKSGKIRKLYKQGEFYPLNEGKMLHEENGKWSVYNAVSGKETPLHFSVANNEWLRVKAIREGIILLSVSNAKHYLLDLNAVSLQQISGSLHILSSSAWYGETITVE